MTGIGEQFQYILRDETIHLNFGVDLINGIKQENPELWTQEFQERDDRERSARQSNWRSHTPATACRTASWA